MVADTELGLRDLNDQIVSETDRAWRDVLHHNERINQERYLSILKDISAPETENEVKVHAISTANSTAESLLKISRVDHGKDAPRVKVLDIYLHPRLDLDGREEHSPEFLDDLWDIAALSISGPISLIFGENPADSIKLYGRTEQLQGYFQAVATHIAQSEGIEGLDVSSHSKWLEFRKIGED